MDPTNPMNQDGSQTMTLPQNPLEAIQERSREADKALLRNGLDVMVPGWQLDPQKIQGLVQSYPGGTEDAMSRLVASAFVSKALEIQPDDAWRGLESYTETLMGQGATYKDTADIVNQNIQARRVQYQIGQMYAELKTLRDMNANPERQQALIAQIEQLRPNAQPLPIKTSIPLQALDGALGFAQSMQQAITSPQAIAGATVGAVGGVLTASGAGAPLGVPMVTWATGLMGAGAFSGLQIGSAVNMAQTEAGQAYQELVESGVSHSIASPIATGVGVINGLIEKAQLDVLTGITDPLLMGILKGAIRKGTRQAVTTGALRQGVTQLALRYGIGIAENTAQEVLQESVTILGTFIGQELDKADVPLEKRITLQDALNRIKDTAYTSALGSALIVLPGAAIRTGMETSANRQGALGIVERVNAIPGVSPEVRQAVLDNVTTDLVEQFEARQETEPTAFSTEAGPELFYHSQDQGGAVFYRGAEMAAASADDLVVASPSSYVEAVRNRYGLAAGEWAQSVIQGQEILTDAAREQLGDQLELMRQVAQETKRGQYDYRRMSPQTREALGDLGLELSQPMVVGAHLDVAPGRVWKGTEAEFKALGNNRGNFDAWDTGDRVVLARGLSKAIVPTGTTEVKNLRLPTKAGRLVTTQTEGGLSVMDPSTREEIARVTLDGDMVTALPDNPVHARQILRELAQQGRQVQVAVPLAQRDQILETDQGYKAALDKLNAASEAQAMLARELREGMTDLELAELEARAQEAGRLQQEALAELNTIEGEILGEPALVDMDLTQAVETAREREQANQEAAQAIVAEIAQVAPQLERVAPAVTRLMEMTANAKGLTLAQWRNTYMATEAFRAIQTPDGQRGLVSFLEDGKAFIGLTTESDASTLVHELGHIVRRTLADQDQATLLKAYGSATWTVEAEEAFARDWETYFLEGTPPQQGLMGIFARLARLMREVYGYIRSMVQPEVRAVIDRAVTNNKADSKAIQSQELELYQPGEIQEQAKALRDAWKNKGVTIDLYPSETKRTAVLSAIKVDKEARGKGLATSAMKDIEQFADQNGILVSLSPTNEWGASKTRLVDFYKRFGFVENKGRNKDYRISETMYRTPRAGGNVLFQPAGDTNSEAFKAWFGDSKVVDSEGRPLVVYHGRDGETLDQFNTKLRFGYHGRKLSVPYFTAFKEYAEGYGKNTQGFYLTIKNPIELSYGDMANIGPEEVERYVAQGYDGAMHHDSSFGDMGFNGKFFEVAPFSPTQIKSVNNTGAWNPEDPRILYQPDMATVDRLVNMEPIHVATSTIPNNKKEWAKKIFDTFPNIINRETGNEIAFVKTAVSKMAGIKKSSVFEIIEALPAIIEGAVFLKEENNKKAINKPRLKSVNHYGALIKVNDLERLVLITTNNWHGKEYVEELDNWAVENKRASAGQKYSGGEAPSVSEAHKNRIVNILREVNHPEFLFQPAYHGTPHRFEKFTTKAMGTGEGVQAYGWGLYFAGSRDVAEWYREKLSPIRTVARFNSNDVEYERTNDGWVGEYGVLDGADKIAVESEYYSQEYAFDLETEIQNAERKGDTTIRIMDYEEVSLAEAKEALKILQSGDLEVVEKRGQLYRVEIPDHEEYLDWDKPLSEQSEKVRTALEDAESNHEAQRIYATYFDPSETGEAHYRGIVLAYREEDGKAQKEAERSASLLLKALGIPGITFLDGNSRGKGEGNYNYVIFDDSDIEIVETYYQPEHAYPEEANTLRRRMDEIEAKGQEPSAEELEEYGQLYRALREAQNLWAHQLRQAVEAGELVPTELIAQASEFDPWASDELAMRRAMGDDVEPGQTDPGVTEQDMKDFGLPTAQVGKEPRTRKEMERAYLERLDADPDGILDGIRHMVRATMDLQAQGWVPEEIDQARMAGFRRLLTGPLYSLVNAKDITKKRKGSSKTIGDIALTSLRNNPSLGMELQALVDGDMVALAQIDEVNQREPLDQTPEAIEAAERERVRKLPFDERMDRLREILRQPFHKADGEGIEKIYGEVSLELRRMSSEFNGLATAHKELNRRFEQGDRAYRQTIDNLKTLGKELAQVRAQASRTDANNQAVIAYLKTRRDTLLAQVREEKAKYRQALVEHKKAIAWVKGEERALAQKQLAQLKAQMERKQKEAEDLRRAREYKRSLVKEIRKPVSKGVDYRYAAQIENIRALLDPRKDRRPAAKAQAVRWFEQNPSAIQAIIDAIGKEPELDPAFEATQGGYTIEQLEDLLEQIIVLETEGKAERTKYLEGEARKVKSAQDAMLRRLVEQYPDRKRETDTGKVPNLAQQFLGALEEMQPILDWLDGGALDYQGPFWKAIYEPFQAATNGMRSNLSRRSQTLADLLKKHGIRPGQMYRELAVDGKPYRMRVLRTTIDNRQIELDETLTWQTALGIYMATKNEQSRDAVTFGNLIGLTDQDRIKRAMPANLKALGDDIVTQIFDADYDRLAEVSQLVQNAYLGKVENYYPMQRQGIAAQPYEEEIAWDAKARAGVKRTAKDGMTKDRVRLSEEMQTAIRLDAFALTVEAIEKQERYIAYQELAKRVGRILSSRSRDGKPLTDRMDTLRPGTTRAILDWTARVVNGNQVKDELIRVMAKLKNNMGAFALGYNLKTAINNVSGLPLYLGEAGPLNLLKAMVSAPANYKAMEDRKHKLAPMLDKRALDVVDQAKANPRSYLGHLYNEFKRIGFIPMRMVVDAMDTIGWNAVYESAIERGLSQGDAANQATAALLRTQPSGDPLATSAIESNPASGIFTPFASQAYKIWNQLAHLPNAKRAGAVKRYIYRVVGVAMSATVFTTLVPLMVRLVQGMVGEQPDDEELADELTRKLLTNLLLANIPLFGGSFTGAIEGYGTSGPLETQTKWLGGLRRVLTEDADQADWEAFAKSLLESGSSLTGLPYIQGKRIVEAIAADDAPTVIRGIHAIVGGAIER